MTDKEKIWVLSRHEIVTCPGCGERICQDDDMSEIEYVRTKRKTDVFFHAKCFEKVWK